jgi:hypothetical protein
MFNRPCASMSSSEAAPVMTALEVLNIDKDQCIVEQRRRDLKQTLYLKPVLLHNDDRIHALIAVIGRRPTTARNTHHDKNQEPTP